MKFSIDNLEKYCTEMVISTESLVKKNYLNHTRETLSKTILFYFYKTLILSA